VNAVAIATAMDAGFMMRLLEKDHVVDWIAGAQHRPGLVGRLVRFSPLRQYASKARARV
jgi:hypothetical protein